MTPPSSSSSNTSSSTTLLLTTVTLLSTLVTSSALSDDMTSPQRSLAHEVNTDHITTHHTSPSHHNLLQNIITLSPHLPPHATLHTPHSAPHHREGSVVEGTEGEKTSWCGVTGETQETRGTNGNPRSERSLTIRRPSHNTTQPTSTKPNNHKPTSKRKQAGNNATAIEPSNLHYGMARRSKVEGLELLGGLFVEAVVAVDWSFHNHHGADVYREVETAVNVASGFLRRVGVVLVVSDVRVWREGDHVTIRPGEDILDNMKAYRTRLLDEGLHHDVTVLLSGVDFGGNVLGRAFTGGMCSGTENGVAIVSLHGRDADMGGFILAHELGHSLGMKHDPPHCPCPTDVCVMDDDTGWEYEWRVQWSGCSVDQLHTRQRDQELHCLLDVPTQIFTPPHGPSCGNGVQEWGEECDCGRPEFCSNKCCDPHTCRLSVNATCAAGECCDLQSCGVKGAGSECRGADGECGLPEYCDGRTRHCPADVHVADGTPCWGDTGYCHHGSCGSHDLRCREVFASSYARQADARCYTKLNAEASQDGNCGVMPGRAQLLPCPDLESAMCGTLQCHAAIPSRLGLPVKVYSYTVDVVEHGLYCTHVTSHHSYPPDLWLAPAGARCGQDKMCVDHQCVPVPSPPSASQCHGGCSGHGRCNSNHNCHCDDGFAPPDCSTKGHGGSLDSGPVPDSGGGAAGIAIGIILVLLLVVLVALVVLWGCLRRWWEGGGRNKMADRVPCCASLIDSCCCPAMMRLRKWLGGRRGGREGGRQVDKRICHVDVEGKGNRWDEASDKLMADVVTKKINSHDSDSPKTRPKYHQSISAVSGCVIEDDSDSNSLHLSLSSLISAFGRVGSKEEKEEAKRKSKISIRTEKTVPLSRLVVDPLAGNRGSCHATPPAIRHATPPTRHATPPTRHATPPPAPTRPAPARPEYRRAYSSDNRPTQPPPPPPINNKSLNDVTDNDVTAPKVSTNLFLQRDKANRHSNTSSSSDSRPPSTRSVSSASRMSGPPIPARSTSQEIQARRPPMPPRSPPGKPPIQSKAENKRKSNNVLEMARKFEKS